HASSAISNLFFHGKAELCRAKFGSCFSEEFVEWVRRQGRFPEFVKGRLFNSCRSIEGEFLSRLSKEPAFNGDRIFAVGPLNPIAADRREREDECLEWLDRQPAASVVYVSFGTTTSMSRRQEREIAAGLEESGQRFIWVRREADRCDVFEAREEGEEDMDLAEWEE
ncbi:cis-zeatin O-glucosyltransferase 1-like, partial [Phalaenopsis equestris]|uniref:cis-zeatin O-glucosyltransferase 1-like n=1 Tax=Phalaenopsis equestris TaxID=78828 RepID=UPI0009E4D78A